MFTNKHRAVYLATLSPAQSTTTRICDGQFRNVQALVDQLGIDSQGPLRILEAGCGSTCRFRLPANSHSTGIDISKEQLERNESLEVKLLGDIETFPLQRSFYDIIFCWDVLEHLEHPERALMNFAQAIRKGGIMILGAPVVASLKGVITKYSPHSVHARYYRWRGCKNAGKVGCHPFRTFLKTSMSPDSIVRFADENQFAIEVHTLYAGQALVHLKNEHKILYGLYFAVGLLFEGLTMGKIPADISDFVLVLRKTTD
jgi:2-polyprenyl-3-methyl-5-hydroxy-6-metoxy-1,4-benzoquinol methylase